MHRLLKMTLLFAHSLAGGPLPPARSCGAVQGAPAPRLIWQAGDIKVTVMEDRANSINISLFSGPAAPAERAAHFDAQGQSPSPVNVFLIQSNGKTPRNILVDAGYGDSIPGESRLFKALAQLKLGPDDIDLVLLTHLHLDHTGGLLNQGKRVFPRAGLMVARTELEHWLALSEKEV
ncbi:MAG: MBL fold metallo-hydrolase, partial [Deltaproteobacteria bacterium]|nr:MBL fold metallo-hydrolase [Deltaproteobacteria bacterium]